MAITYVVRTEYQILGVEVKAMNIYREKTRRELGHIVASFQSHGPALQEDLAKVKRAGEPTVDDVALLVALVGRVIGLRMFVTASVEADGALFLHKSAKA